MLRTKEYLAVIRPGPRVLVLEALFFADEIRPPAEVVGTVPKAKVGEREMPIARQLIDSMATVWDPKRYRDTYRERVVDLLERKAQGEEIVVEEPQAQPRVLDLIAALDQSLEAARQGRRTNGGGRRSKASRSRSASRSKTNGSRSTSRLDRSRAGGSGTARARDYGSWPKSRLADEARRRDIPGRSRMGREELVEALQRAS